MSKQVFISHSSADGAVADRVCRQLESAGIPCWIAPRDLVPGTDWGDAIVRALGECRAMVVILSGSANDSREVRREVQCAFESRLAVIPLRVEHVRPARGLRYYLGSVHWLDVYPPKEHRMSELPGLVRAHLSGTPGGDGAAGDPPPAPPLAYATPPPVRRGRRAGAFAVIGAGAVLVSGALIRAQKERSREAALQAVAAQRSAAATAAVAAAVRPPVPPAAAPLASQGATATSEILQDLSTLDLHAGAIDEASKAEPAARVAALRSLANSPAIFASCVNTFGTTRGSSGSGSAAVRDRVAALGALGAGAQSVRAFADALFDFARAEGELSAELDELDRRQVMAGLAVKLGFAPATEPGPDDATASAEAASLRALADVAYAAGLRLLSEAGANRPGGTNNVPAAIKHLEPKAFPPPGELDALTAAAAARARDAADGLRAELARGGLRQAAVVDDRCARLVPPFRPSAPTFEALRALQPADTPEPYRLAADEPAPAAAARAAAARRDGWEAASVVAFFGYAARFAPTDPAADDYARAAVQYVLRRDRLGLPERQGVLYVAAAGAPAGEDALRPHDLLIACGDKVISDTNDLAAAVKELPPDQPVSVEVLRRDDRGAFARRRVVMPPGVAASGQFLPI